MNYDYKSLEYYEFKSYLKNAFVSQYSIEALEELSPCNSLDTILKTQSEIKESINYVDSRGLIENDEDFYKLHKKIKNEDFFVEPLDFLIISKFLSLVENIKVKLLIKQFKVLRNKIVSLNTIQDLKNEINRCITDKGEISDNATNELKDIRKGVKEYGNYIRKSLNNILNSSNSSKFIQDKVVIIRSGRYTIPCKTNFSQYVDGIIHDKSTSGQTLYIEPTSCVTLNNNMQELIIKESEEIAKILYKLVKILNESKVNLEKLIEDYKYLVFRLELGLFYQDKNYTFAEIGDKVIFKDIHHPLLYLRKIDESIGIDFEIGNGVNLAIITGANTGGKTAGLKSIGLNHLITFSGLPIFGSYSRCIHYDNIYADIGDKQSLIMDLSTFSSHMTNINDIINKASENTLILFDELGTGTEPREGASLAIGILKYLEMKSSTVIVTTHFAEVKNYGLNNSKSIFYSVDFDYENFIPRYRLLKNIIGKSDPIMIAKRLGFNSDVINIATNELNKYKTGIEMQVEQLNSLIAENEHIKRTLDIKEKELFEKEYKLVNSEETLKKKLNSKELELLEESYALLKRSKRLAEERIKNKVEIIEKEIKNTAEKIENIKKYRKSVKDIQVNEIIFLERYNKTAKILAINGSKVSLNIEGLRVTLNKDDLIGYKVENKPSEKVKIKSSISTTSKRLELLLVGNRVEEALDKVDKFIDESVLTGYDKVFLIHGRGSGKLRKAVHEYLQTDIRVKNYKLAENSEGGNAITIVEL